MTFLPFTWTFCRLPKIGQARGLGERIASKHVREGQQYAVGLLRVSRVGLQCLGFNDEVYLFRAATIRALAAQLWIDFPDSTHWSTMDSMTIARIRLTESFSPFLFLHCATVGCVPTAECQRVVYIALTCLVEQLYIRHAPRIVKDIIRDHLPLLLLQSRFLPPPT